MSRDESTSPLGFGRNRGNGTLPAINRRKVAPDTELVGSLNNVRNQRTIKLDKTTMLSSEPSIDGDDDGQEEADESESEASADDQDEEIKAQDLQINKSDLMRRSLIGNSMKQLVDVKLNSETTKRNKARNLNRPKFFHAIKKSQGYINELKFDVRLNELYTVVDSCSYNEKNYWCPILLKVGDRL